MSNDGSVLPPNNPVMRAVRLALGISLLALFLLVVGATGAFAASSDPGHPSRPGAAAGNALVAQLVKPVARATENTVVRAVPRLAEPAARADSAIERVPVAAAGLGVAAAPVRAIAATVVTPTATAALAATAPVLATIERIAQPVTDAAAPLLDPVKDILRPVVNVDTVVGGVDGAVGGIIRPVLPPVPHLPGAASIPATRPVPATPPVPAVPAVPGSPGLAAPVPAGAAHASGVAPDSWLAGGDMPGWSAGRALATAANPDTPAVTCILVPAPAPGGTCAPAAEAAPPSGQTAGPGGPSGAAAADECLPGTFKAAGAGAAVGDVDWPLPASMPEDPGASPG
ncbi:hypothetical protein AB4Y80_03085 [Specibacter sp. RAF43]